MKTYLFIVLSACCVHTVHSQQNKLLLQYYDSSMITVDVKLFGGISLSHRGNTCSSTFGVSESMKTVLSKYESSKGHYSSYSSQNSFGKVLAFGGVAVSLVGILQVRRGSSLDKQSKAFDLFLIGSIVEIIGVFVLQHSYTELLKSVNSYNRECIGAYQQ